MRRLRLSGAGRRDVLRILSASEERWGARGRERYEALLNASFRLIADELKNPLVQDCSNLQRGLRCLHLKHSVRGSGSKVRHPVHIVYFRIVNPEIVEIVRVLHERMDQRRYFAME